MLETFYDLDELEVAIAAVRSVSPADRGADELRQRRRDDRRRLGARRRRAAAAGSTSPRSARTTAAGLPRALNALAEMAGDGACSRPSRTSASRASRAAASSTRTRRPSTSPSSRRTRATLGARLIGGCCGTTPAADRRDPQAIEDENAPPGASARGPSASQRRALGEAQRRRSSRGRCARASSSSPCSSTRRSAVTPRPARGSHAALKDSGRVGSSTSTTTRAPARG